MNNVIVCSCFQLFSEDVLVGYQFTNIMYRNHNDEVLVDLQKVDDVKLQKHEKVPPQPQDSQE